jgi:pimeloyl-ACP methyl ester carboxylesterase
MNRQELYQSPAAANAVMSLYDSMLANWATPHQTWLLPTRHGETFVIASGDKLAPPIVLLHGAGSNAAIWLPDMTLYRDHYRVYALDLPGEPGKTAPNRLPWDGPAYTEWLTDTLDELEIDKAILVGMSLGGWTAARFASAYPERVEQLVLMCPGGIAPTRALFMPRTVLFTLLGQWGIRRLVQGLFADQPIPPGTVEAVVLISRSFRARMETLPLMADKELDRLTMPTLLLGGTKDILCDMEKTAERLRPRLPHLTVTFIPGAGHALLNTTPYVHHFLQIREPMPYA